MHKYAWCVCVCVGVGVCGCGCVCFGVCVSFCGSVINGKNCFSLKRTRKLIILLKAFLDIPKHNQIYNKSFIGRMLFRTLLNK